MKKVFKVILIVLCMIVIVYPFCVSSLTISGSSMEPNVSDGFVAYTDRIAYKLFKIKRFDIVIAKKDNGELIIKRVIGLPNETIRYEDGVLYVNGNIVEEDFIDSKTKQDTNSSSYYNYDLKESITLGDDEYFLLGDNRFVSYDSRFLGPFSIDQIYGRVILFENNKKLSLAK